jgi:hypothetical protein
MLTISGRACYHKIPPQKNVVEIICKKIPKKVLTGKRKHDNISELCPERPAAP